VGGKSGPQETTVRTTRVPEGRIQRINAVVILGFDASANERWRAGQMARQALGLQSTRGDTLNVYAIPAAVQAATAPEAASPESQPQLHVQPKPAEPVSIPQVRSRSSPPVADMLPAFTPWWLAAAGGGVLLAGLMWWRARQAPAPELPIDDLDSELEAMRNQVQADPRVTADVIKLWMRA
jgi:hypothetical protein